MSYHKEHIHGRLTFFLTKIPVSLCSERNQKRLVTSFSEKKHACLNTTARINGTASGLKLKMNSANIWWFYISTCNMDKEGYNHTKENQLSHI